LDIPHVTLLDLDAGRHQGGWGRIRNTVKQMHKAGRTRFKQEAVDAMPAWDDDVAFPAFEDKRLRWVAALERHGVFFSHPVDLDLMMLDAYPKAYDVTHATPDEQTVVSVLGKGHVNAAWLGVDVLELFEDYHAEFDLRSKPDTHLAALSTLTDEEVLADLPAVLGRLVERVKADLAGLPE
jgi:putative ATP-dependent endonuclease of OLD family